MPAGAFRKIDVGNQRPSVYLGLLGMTTGLTAYAGIHRVGEVSDGDVVVVSAAAGAVGSVACQLAKRAGANVIGIAGGQAKCAYLLEEVGCDTAIDYKAQNVGEALDAAAAKGVDVYLDNVGGELLDTLLDRITTGARVVICGAISQYDDLSAVRGPSHYLKVAERNASMRGFTVDHYATEFDSFAADISAQMNDGLHLREHEEMGIESFPKALRTLFTGGHVGKLLVKTKVAT